MSLQEPDGSVNVDRQSPCTRRIICIDSSKDEVGTFGALRESLELAALECGVNLPHPIDWTTVRGNEHNRPERCWIRTTVQYHDGSHGELLLVKAMVSQQTALGLLRYAATDDRFPNYSTSDQFLTAEQFVGLARLGFSNMEEALWS